MTVFRLTPTQRQAAANYGLPLALLTVLLYLILRNTGAYPVVFADEWLYSKFARLQPLSDSLVPSYLYLKLFGQTNACGEGFLQCARVLNAVLFVAAAPFIYLVARPLTGRLAAGAIAVLALLSPISSYTAYFMPEAMYYFGFWVLTYTLLRSGALRPQWRATLAYGLLGGVLLGLLCLVKVHALFLLPALCLFIVYARFSASRKDWLVPGLAAAVLAAVAALAVKTALAWLLAGPVGLNLFGSFYGGHVNNSGHGLGRLLAPFLRNFQGHAMALLVLFGFPILMIASAAASGAVRTALGRHGRALLLYTFLMLGCALGMTVAYTASIADAGPNEIIRLHLRYYDFTFPLLMIAGVAVAGHGARASLRTRAMLAAPLALLVALAARFLLPAYLTSPIDSPELFSLAGKSPLPLYLMAALTLALIALWVAQPRRAAPLYLMVLLPLAALAGEAVNVTMLQRLQQPSVYDKAGRFAHSFLDAADRDALSIAGADLAGMMRAQFHVDSAHSTTIELQPGAPFELTQTPARQRWLLVVGPHRLPPELTPLVATNEYALVRLNQGSRRLFEIPMSQPLANGALESTTGLADAEPWGVWSNADVVTLRFAKPLPPHLAVLINGRAFGPNAGLPFTLHAGDDKGEGATFRLPANPQEVFLRLETDGQQRELRIRVPRPTTPLEVGAGNDQRRLGIGLISVEIGEAAPAVPAPATN
jgi:phosphoglycerol transferase